MSSVGAHIYVEADIEMWQFGWGAIQYSGFCWQWHLRVIVNVGDPPRHGTLTVVPLQEVFRCQGVVARWTSCSSDERRPVGGLLLNAYSNADVKLAPEVVDIDWRMHGWI